MERLGLVRFAGSLALRMLPCGFLPGSSSTHPQPETLGPFFDSSGSSRCGSETYYIHLYMTSVHLPNPLKDSYVGYEEI